MLYLMGCLKEGYRFECSRFPSQGVRKLGMHCVMLSSWLGGGCMVCAMVRCLLYGGLIYYAVLKEETSSLPDRHYVYSSMLQFRLYIG
jgi:hypothetical protein